MALEVGQRLGPDEILGAIPIIGLTRLIEINASSHDLSLSLSGERDRVRGQSSPTG